jgi:hypothetical protein
MMNLCKSSCKKAGYCVRVIFVLICLAVALYLVWPHLVEMNKNAQHHYVKEVAEYLNHSLKVAQNTARQHLIDGHASIESYILDHQRRINVLVTNYGEEPVATVKNVAFVTRYFSIVGAVPKDKKAEFTKEEPSLLDQDVSRRLEACQSILKVLLDPQGDGDSRSGTLMHATASIPVTLPTMGAHVNFSAVHSDPFDTAPSESCVWLHKSEHFALRYTLPSNAVKVIDWSSKKSAS